MPYKHINKPVSFTVDEIERLGQLLINTDEIESEGNFLHQLRMLMMSYESAIKEITTKFEVLNLEMAITTEHNPIQSIKSRIKSAKSIIAKLKKYELDFDIESIEEHLNDIAGIRVIVGYIDEIYALVDMLLRQDDITLIKTKDYIQHPKENGYRSLHLVVSVPVFFSNMKKDVKVEIQIRTIAMDFWASLEHSLRYKNTSQIESNIYKELNDAAKVINDTDRRMMLLRQSIDKYDKK